MFFIEYSWIINKIYISLVSNDWNIYESVFFCEIWVIMHRFYKNNKYLCNFTQLHLTNTTNYVNMSTIKIYGVMQCITNALQIKLKSL